MPSTPDDALVSLAVDSAEQPPSTAPVKAAEESFKFEVIVAPQPLDTPSSSTEFAQPEDDVMQRVGEQLEKTG